MPLGRGTLLVGMGERSSPQAIGQLAEALFERARAGSGRGGGRCMSCPTIRDPA